MIDLDKVKAYLNIDFTDNDSYIEALIKAAKSKASNATGICQDDILFEGGELENAMLMDIAEMYQSRGESESGSKSAMATYRRLSKRPMF